MGFISFAIFTQTNQTKKNNSLVEFIYRMKQTNLFIYLKETFTNARLVYKNQCQQKNYNLFCNVACHVELW